ncbi:hypothetical protein BJV77DRAFT_1152962 [Russula vinacea]|nr:hypothetical protein BJV77DRAFT_1152962 [Russula vinacea]
MTDNNNTVRFPPESNVQASVFSEVIARVESRFNHFRTVIHDPDARVAAICAIDKEIDEQLKANLGWIRATHVCRFWRQVALDDSSLWATISGISEKTELIYEMLARSRNAPLDIDIHVDEHSGRKVLNMFPPHFSHIRELRLHGPSILRTAVVRGIYLEAPALEHFELGVPIDSPITFRSPGGTRLFKGQAPRLRTVSLFQVLTPWPLIPRGQLTHLKIVLFQEISADNIPSCGDLNQLIDLLVNCPGLEILDLEHSLPPQLTPVPRDQTIHLPCLSCLYLVGSSSRLTNLVKMLKLPSSTRLYLRCISENTSAHDDHLLLPVVSAQLQGLAPIGFKYFSVTLGCKHDPLTVTASTSVPTSRIRQFRGFEDDKDDGDDEFVLSFDELSEFGQRIDLREVCKMLPISNLEFLSICAFDSVNWIDLFERCTNLTTLQVIGHGTSGLVRALTTSNVTNTRRSWNRKRHGSRDSRDIIPVQPARSTARPVHGLIFPKLEYLSLNGLDFAENEHPSGILFEVVEKCLLQRKAQRKAL